MDEAAPRIRQALAKLQGLPAGAVMTEAHRVARKAVKTEWQAQGLKVAWVEHSKLVEASRDYLDSHRAELISQAHANLSNYVQRRKC